MKNKSSGRIWPYAIGGAVTLVFGFCVATVVVTSKADIQKSDSYMTSYQDADANINNYIKAKIAFNKKYDIEYLTKKIGADASEIKYKITDKAGNPVDNAKITIAISRPETEKFNKTFSDAKVENGVYTFDKVQCPKAGVWNIIASVEVGDYNRFYNIKADTRMTSSYEY